MPELPEITVLARQMDAGLTGKTFAAITVDQPKCLNVAAETFTAALTGATVGRTTQRGKWLFVDTDRGHLLLNLGMGGEVWLVTRETLPAKHRLLFDFTDDGCLSVNFGWFGYAHYVAAGSLADHTMTAGLGPNALELDAAGLRARIGRGRGRIKSLLLDQDVIAGIGNAYIHDILFLARLHPLRSAASLSDAEWAALAAAIRQGLQPSIDKGGAFYETDLYGQHGGFTMDDILVGYKEGKPCPVCATPLVKIKTGSTASFLCPTCQPAPGG